LARLFMPRYGPTSSGGKWSPSDDLIYWVRSDVGISAGGVRAAMTSIHARQPLLGGVVGGRCAASASPVAAVVGWGGAVMRAVAAARVVRSAAGTLVNDAPETTGHRGRLRIYAA